VHLFLKYAPKRCDNIFKQAGKTTQKKGQKMKEWIAKIENKNSVKFDLIPAGNIKKAEIYYQNRGIKALVLPYSPQRLKAICEAAKKDYDTVILSPEVSSKSFSW
jgi:pyruvate/2-oxoglutarate/acetoin dehydrogenase E1 component